MAKKRRSDDDILAAPLDPPANAVQPKRFYAKDPNKSRSAISPSESKKSTTEVGPKSNPDREASKKQS